MEASGMTAMSRRSCSAVQLDKVGVADAGNGAAEREAEANGASSAVSGRPLRGRPRGRAGAAPATAKKIARRAKRLQEVALAEGDGARILGRRIKVFWRDEGKWFYGVVKAYNRGRRTHKIVYDDREEEWVKLHDEKFKLQVMKGEVFGAQQESRIRERAIEVPVVVVAASAESPGFCRDGGQMARVVEDSEHASAMVCESADLEDPYAIDHTSISDSLVLFMRSKQSRAQSRIEVSPGVDAPLSSRVEIDGVAEASGVVPDPGAEGAVDFESSNECGRQDVAEVLGGSADCGLHGNEDGESRDAVMSDVDAVPRLSGEAACVVAESTEKDALNADDGAEESGNRAEEGREAGPCCLASVSEPAFSRESRREVAEMPSPWSVRTGRFLSWSLGASLVNIDCRIPGQHLAFWILGVDNVWRCVPYLTLFVDVILEGDRLKGACTRRCYGERSAKGVSLRRSVLSAVFSRSRGSPGLTCPSSTLGSARIVLHGSRTPLEMLLRQGNEWEVVAGSDKANEGFLESACASSDRMSDEHSCSPEVGEQAREPSVEEHAGPVVGLPVVEVLDDEGEEDKQPRGVVVASASPPRDDEADVSESDPGAPSPLSAEDDAVREANGAEGAGSGAGLTDVQIGSAVEGEDEGGLACYRSWKSAKRGFSQITPEELGSGLGSAGMLQGLLDSELGCMALTKSRSTDTGNCESAVPRVNVLKLRKCPTGKGGWHVADRSVMQSDGGGDLLTPSSIPDRKRSFREYLELNQAGSPVENGQGLRLTKGLDANGHEGAEEVKARVKGMWSNCEVSSIQDVPHNPRKRFKHGSTSSGSSDDSYVPEVRGAESYPSRNGGGKVYLNSVCQGCMANVLVVQHDRGWRERGATVELRSCNGQGWMLVISVRGETMYAYKAEQAMATGSTNRHSHAMVWKGAKGWSLEFEEKKQWHVFKELHEECYRRNGKLSSVRQIPIPGVRHIEEVLPRSPGCHFVRPYGRYICREEDEVEVALGKSRVVYDMDSEDELWLARINTERASARGTRTRPLIAEETLERVMDKLEKDSYLHEQQHKDAKLDPNDVGAESCTGLATQEVIKAIYGYWVEKRTRKGMPLVRHFQPPAWDQYQKQLKAWEQEIAALQKQHPSASLQQLTEGVRKPALFAFCLRPRGLEVQPKLSKQKSHKKQPWTGSTPRAWVGLASLNGSLARRQYYSEPGNGALAGPRRPGRPRLTEVAGANLSGTFNTMMRTSGVPVRPMDPSMEHRIGSLNEYSQRRPGMGKKVGRKARRQRLLAAAQESRRKRTMMRDVSSIELEEDADLAVAAGRARSIAVAARARAQALYAVADAAMHKAVAAVIEADALRAVELAQNTEAAEAPAARAEPGAGPTFGSWRRGVPVGSGTRHGLESDGEDALLPVASWSQELGAGLGTRLLNKDAEMGGGMGLRSVHGDRRGVVDVGLVRARG